MKKHWDEATDVACSEPPPPKPPRGTAPSTKHRSSPDEVANWIESKELKRPV